MKKRMKKVIRSPKNCRKFVGHWDLMVYLCSKTFYWLHIRRNRSCAKKFAIRLKHCLEATGDLGIAIIGSEALCLIAEYEGDFETGLALREKEVSLIIRLFNEVQHNELSTQRFALGGGYAPCQVITKLDFLKGTYGEGDVRLWDKELVELQNKIRLAGRETGVNRCGLSSTDLWR